MTLQGKSAVVTGGGTGVGAAVALALAEAGAVVTIVGRREAPLQEVARKSARIHCAVADVTDAVAMQHLLADAAERHGAPQILVANAGAALSKPFGRMEASDLQEMLAVNVAGVFNLWRAGLAGMEALGTGRLIVVASLAGLKGYPYVAGYVAAKHAVVGLTRAVALEVARRGITANAICPGFVETDMLERSVDTIVEKTGRTREAARAALAAGNPQGRLIQPSEIAATVLWLCSEGAASVNGQALALSGGEV